MKTNNKIPQSSQIDKKESLYYTFYMKKFLILLILILFLMSCRTSPDVVEEIETDYFIPHGHRFDGKIARWFDFHQSAASITFDDATYDQYLFAFPLLEKMNMKATFFLPAGLLEKEVWNDHGTIRKLMSWEEAALIASAGHEIGSHSLNHRDMSLPGTDLKEEFLQSKLLIEKSVPQTRVETFCWPHWREPDGGYNEISQYYISARSGNGLVSYYLERKGGIPSHPPENMFGVNSLGIMNDLTFSRFKDIAKEVSYRETWFVTSFHGIGKWADDEGLKGGWSSIEVEKLQNILSYFQNNDFWIETFGTVSKYIYERESAELEIYSGERSVKIILEDGLNDLIYNEPLSISLYLPSHWKTLTIENSKGPILDYKLVKNQLFLHIPPDGEVLTIKPY